MPSPLILLGRRRTNPARFVAATFAVAVALGAGLLVLPMAHAGGDRTTLLEALFTATSAVCVTGLTVVDTATHWSGFGKVVILALVQLGGLGIMTLASFVVLRLNRRLGVNAKQLANTERAATTTGEVGSLLVAVVRFSMWFEGIGAVLLFLAFRLGHDQGWADAAWGGVFHSVTAFNNAGFGLRSDNLVTFVDDPFVNIVVMVLVVAGGLGFPVLMELRRKIPRGRAAVLARRPLSLHTRVTLITSGGLLAVGTFMLLATEWTNGGTLGPMPIGEKVMAASFQSVQTRTAGFNTIDIGAMNQASWLVMSVLMFIGGGSASTAGGIKVTTFAIIGMMIWSEVRGDADVNIHRRRIAERAQRRAVAIAALSLGAVVGAGLVFVAISPFDIDQSLFEVTSAFGTVGLTTGITAALGPAPQLVLVALMYLGRLGPLTLGAALVLRERDLRFRYPEEQPIIG
ncbi:MAG: potassium transporter TrkG [Ilumatobacteraceae bacterium]